MSRADSQNSAKLAIVLVGIDLTIRHFSPADAKVLGLLAADVGRPISQLGRNVAFGSDAGVYFSLGPEDLSAFAARAPLYDARQQGARRVLALLDIDTVKRSEQEIMGEALQQTHAQLRAHARFNRVAIGRELRMIDLKKEISELCQRPGHAARYPLEFESDGTGTEAHETDPW